MTDFDALLKRSFAEAPEPVDDGFSLRVETSVARSENALKVRNAAYTTGMAAAAVAVFYGAYSLAGAYGPEMLAAAGIEVARAHGAISSAPSVGGSAQALLTSLGAGLTQIMLVIGALAGGAVAYRATQE